MHVMVIDRGNGDVEFHKNLEFQEVMELEDRCDAEELTYYSFDAGEPVREFGEDLNLTQEDITQSLDMHWPHFASI